MNFLSSEPHNVICCAEHAFINYAESVQECFWWSTGFLLFVFCGYMQPLSIHLVEYKA